MAGFDKNRFISKTTVDPNAAAGRVVPSAAGQVHAQFAADFAKDSLSLFEDVEREDIARGTVAGANAIIVKKDGTVTRGPRPKNVTTSAGFTAFQKTQRVAGMNARINGLTLGIAELHKDALNSPNPVEYMTEGLKVLSDTLVGSAPQDVQGIIAVSAVEQGRQALNSLGMAMDKIEREGQTKLARQVLGHKSNEILAKARNGGDTRLDRATLKALVDEDVAARIIDEAEGNEILHEAEMNSLSGEAIRSVTHDENNNPREAFHMAGSVLKIQEILDGPPEGLNKWMIAAGIEPRALTTKERNELLAKAQGIMDFKLAIQSRGTSAKNAKASENMPMILAQIRSLGEKPTEAGIKKAYRDNGVNEKQLITNEVYRRYYETQLNSLFKDKIKRDLTEMNRKFYDMKEYIAKTDYKKDGMQAILKSHGTMMTYLKSGALEDFPAKEFELRQFMAKQLTDHLSQAKKDYNFFMENSVTAAVAGHTFDMKALKLAMLQQNKAGKWFRSEGGQAFAKKLFDTYGFFRDSKDQKILYADVDRADAYKAEHKTFPFTPKGTEMARISIERTIRAAKDEGKEWGNPTNRKGLTELVNRAASDGVISPQLKEAFVLGHDSSDMETGQNIGVAYLLLKKADNLAIMRGIPEKLKPGLQDLANNAAAHFGDQNAWDKFHNGRASQDEEIKIGRTMMLDALKNKTVIETVKTVLDDASSKTDIISKIAGVWWGGADEIFEVGKTLQFLNLDESFSLFDKEYFLDSVTVDLIRQGYSIHRPKYGTQTDADQMAVKAAIADMAASGYGPDRFSPRSDGAEIDGKIRFMKNSFTRWAGGEKKAIILMDNLMQKFMQEKAFNSGTTLGKVPLNFKDYSFSPSWKRLEIITSGIRDGWITMYAQPGSTLDKPIYNVFIRDPLQRADLSGADGVHWRYEADKKDISMAMGQFRIDKRDAEREQALGDTLETSFKSDALVKPRGSRGPPLSLMSLGMFQKKDPYPGFFDEDDQ